jgi:starch synthase
MRILLASSEAVPFSKTGGLADVSSALAKALRQLGHDVWLIVPHYPQVKNSGPVPEIQQTGRRIDVPVGQQRRTGMLLKSQLPDCDVPVLLVDQADYFHRKELYRESGVDYKDNCARFVFFSRAVFETARSLELRPDIIHANDWQSGLVPALLEIEYRPTVGFERTKSVFTIHNMAFQGQFWHWDMLLTGLSWKYFNWKQMEFYDHLNLLKTGIVFANMITTVSPTYAQEIQTSEFGAGLEGVLAARSDHLVGILNGVDTDIWNPKTDPAIAENYSAESFCKGKAACKATLQKKVGLATRPDAPLFGMISRMTDQKGFDLICDGAAELVKNDLQLCILGSGEANYEKKLLELARNYPDRVAVKIGFDDKLAHEIEAGCDLFLMPSRYEPCGLNQMYSLIYGTVPVVRSVGGLADSVVDATEWNLANGTATGFRFADYDSRELLRQIRRAVELFAERDRWLKLVRTGMQQDWSWKRSAAQYASVYGKLLAR